MFSNHARDEGAAVNADADIPTLGAVLLTELLGYFEYFRAASQAAPTGLSCRSGTPATAM